MPQRPQTFRCPHCGAKLPVEATFCRKCGADEETGWGESDDHNLPDNEDDDFDYEEYLEHEFPQHANPSPARQWKKLGFFWIVVLLCLALWLTSVYLWL